MGYALMDLPSWLGGRRSDNLDVWFHLQNKDYFENHPCYRGLVDMGDSERRLIETFCPLTPGMRVAVIGVGYGRETRHIAPCVGHVYGIDVSDKILSKATQYLAKHGVENFTPVLASNYAAAIPAGIDLVFSIVVMQHLTRTMVRHYFANLAGKFASGGKLIVQFEEKRGANLNADAGRKMKEPSVAWSVFQIADLVRDSGLTLDHIRTITPSSPHVLWHWAFASKA
jgi:cyclopropane fatty-acyl-phospholipid synthase-like methyltransferase